MRRRFGAITASLAVLATSPAAADRTPPASSDVELPGPSDPSSATQAGLDAGPAPSRHKAAVAAADAGAAVKYRVFATQYEPNTSGSVEVALPDKCAKFAALGWTSALSSANCPSGYRLDLDWRVVVRRDSGQHLTVRLKEVGPWNTGDNYWNSPNGDRPRRLFTDLPRGMPESHAAFYDGYNTVSNCKKLDGSLSGRAGAADQFGRCVLNPAGIDLSVAAAAKLGLGHLQNDWVTVEFLWERDAPSSFSRRSHVLWHNTTNGKATRWIMAGTRKKRSARIVLPPGARFPRPDWVPVATGDFNRDGPPDLLWWKESKGALLVWFMKRSSRIGHARIDTDGATMGPGWRPIGVDDFDRDGRPDVAWHNIENGRVAIWYMKRTTRRRSATVDLPSGVSWPSGVWTPFATVDFNGDQIPDFAWHNATTGRVEIWYMSGADGNRMTSSDVVSRGTGMDWPSPSTWEPVGAGDFDRKGVPDLLWHNTSNGSLVVWTMRGSDGNEATDAVRVNASSFPPPTKVPIVWR